MSYVRVGEKQKLHKRYKCRVRTPWYTVPSVYATEVGMLKRSHHTPRLILNALGAYSTDTAYRVRCRKVSARRLVSCFLNPLTALSAELEGRHYGGGVLELVPSEIECLAIPLPVEEFDVKTLDAAVREMTAERILERHGKKVLDALGVASVKQEQLLQGWMTLRNRRQRTSSQGAGES